MMSKFARAFGFFSLGLGISLLIGYWLKQEELRSRRLSSPSFPQPPVPYQPDEHITLSSAVLKANDTAQVPDDLTRLTGVGPKTAEALHTIGITTFAGMAAATPQELAEKLKGLRGISPEKVSNWIKQAAELAS